MTAVTAQSANASAPYGPGRLTGGSQVIIHASTLDLQVNATIGPAGATVSGGFGGWEAVAIPRRDVLTEWIGRPALLMDLDLLFNAWGLFNMTAPAKHSVEAQCDRLEKLAVTQPGMATPPVVRLFGAVPHAGYKWVIQDLDWNEVIRDSVTGVRMRQAVVVKLMKYNDPAPSAFKGVATPTHPRRYVVKRGDIPQGLKGIAARHLGNSARWPQIANPNLNKGLRGWGLANSHVGRTILLPP